MGHHSGRWPLQFSILFLIRVIENPERIVKYWYLIQLINGTEPGHSLSVHNGEIAQRKTFSESCEGHFLALLFPGIVDQFSPSFATCSPPAFDTNLPPVTIEDLEKLKQALPSLWSTLKLPENLKVAILIWTSCCRFSKSLHFYRFKFDWLHRFDLNFQKSKSIFTQTI